jgi:hypothetical protein
MSDPTKEPCSYEVVVHANTVYAVLCEVLEADTKVWIPFSEMMEDSDEVRTEGDEGTIIIPRWLAEEKGLE